MSFSNILIEIQKLNEFNFKFNPKILIFFLTKQSLSTSIQLLIPTPTHFLLRIKFPFNKKSQSLTSLNSHNNNGQQQNINKYIIFIHRPEMAAINLEKISIDVQTKSSKTPPICRQFSLARRAAAAAAATTAIKNLAFVHRR
jgi:hypothetical protein